MAKHTSAYAALTLLLGCPTLAQAPTLNAIVTQPLTVTAMSATTVQQTQPVGPLPAAGVHLQALSGLTIASLTCRPTSGHPTGVSGFELQTSGGGWPLSQFSSFSVDGEVILILSAPTPTPVLVTAIGGATANVYASTLTELDIDNDQTIDHSWMASTFNGNVDEDGEFGLLVGPTGRSLRIRHASSGSPDGAASQLELTFYSGASPVEPYGPGCLPLTWSRGPTGGIHYHTQAAGNSLAFFAFGFQPMQTPLAIAPGCFQLTDVLFAIAALPSGGEATFAQAPVALPTGVEFRVQSAVISGGGTIQTSNGLRVFGPN